MDNQRTPTPVWAYAALFLVALWSLFPVLMIVITSFRPNLAGLAGGNPFFFPFRVENYVNVWRHTGFLHYLVNTLIISLSACAISVGLGLPAAYALARFQFRGRLLIAQWLLSIRLAPAIAFVVPFFMMFKTLKLLDTPAALILIYSTFLLPFSIWMLSSYIQEIPVESEEAAFVDGYSHFGVMCKVVLPQTLPAIGAVSLLNITAAWNEFLFALILTSSHSVTLPVAVSGFLGERGVFWGQMAAAGVLIMIIPIVISTLIHQTMAKGMTLGLEHSH